MQEGKVISLKDRVGATPSVYDGCFHFHYGASHYDGR